jgi:hypothetical protein
MLTVISTYEHGRDAANMANMINHDHVPPGTVR